MADTVVTKGSIRQSGGGTGRKIAAGNFFTTASDEWAILTISPTGVGSDYITVGSATFKPSASLPNIYVPPSTTVSWGSGTIDASWVIFKNT